MTRTDVYVEAAAGAEPAGHASLRCACGVNDAGQRFTDPICRGR